ncbi:MAG: glycosyltransferase family 2 protein [Gammaproteobacteria bacterium]|nr:MAG: glycosyltransferase family 2 protein [Gammaproteobacteria bacterium]
MQHNPVGARTAQARTAGGGAARGRERFDDAQRPWSLFALFSVCALLVGWIALSAATDEAASLLVYGLANLIVFMDAIDFGVRLYVHRRHTAVASELGGGETHLLSIDLAGARGGRTGSVRVRPYAIIASIYNLEDELDEFMERLQPYRDHVWLISDGSTDKTAKRLQQAGWRCLDEEVNDPDVRICGRHEGSVVDLERAIADLQQSGAAAACPRIAIERDGFLARFQALEYTLCFMVGRRSLADYGVTSGVSIYRRDALEWALAQHSMSIYAEDLENTVILLHAGERIYYDGRLVVSTHGPHTVRRWYSQRVGWYYGFLRLYTQRTRELWRIGRRAPFAMYNFIGYMGVLGLGLHVLRIASAALLLVSAAAILDGLFALGLLPTGRAINPASFAGAIGSYLVLAVIALFTVVPRRERAYVGPILPIYFLYVLAHIVPITVGFGNWVALRLWGRRIYRDHYQLREDDPTVPMPPLTLRPNGSGTATL